VSHSLFPSLYWTGLTSICVTAYLGGDFRVSVRANADTEILLTYLIAFLMELLSPSVQPVWT
jgi:hypothetical protein